MNQEASKKQAAYPPPQRVRFAEHEQRLPWLSTLMDAYLITDQGISEAISREEKQGKNWAVPAAANPMKPFLSILWS